MNTEVSPAPTPAPVARSVTAADYAYNDRYINRELSILDFHLRVLEQAVDPLHPLLERLNFLLIFSLNNHSVFHNQFTIRNFCQTRIMGYNNKSLVILVS